MGGELAASLSFARTPGACPLPSFPVYSDNYDGASLSRLVSRLFRHLWRRQWCDGEEGLLWEAPRATLVALRRLADGNGNDGSQNIDGRLSRIQLIT